MARYTFAQIPDVIAKYERRMTAVFRESAERAIEIMQEPGPSVTNPASTGTGNMPVATGFLRASLLVSTSHMPTINPAASGKPNETYDWDEGEISLAIAGADIGDALFAGYTASYARIMEARYGFVRLAAQQWPAIVNEVAREVVLRIR